MERIHERVRVVDRNEELAELNRDPHDVRGRGRIDGDGDDRSSRAVHEPAPPEPVDADAPAIVVPACGPDRATGHTRTKAPTHLHSKRLIAELEVGALEREPDRHEKRSQPPEANWNTTPAGVEARTAETDVAIVVCATLMFVAERANLG